jgi:hypothetical protein
MSILSREGYSMDRRAFITTAVAGAIAASRTAGQGIPSTKTVQITASSGMALPK